MAAFGNVRLDRRGVGSVLKSDAVGRAIDALAEDVADNVRSQGLTVSDGSDLPVTVTPHTTDRRAASVALAHPAGIAMQAKYGALTKAASDAGLEVKGGEA